MLPIRIDLQDIADEFILSKDEIDDFARYVVQVVSAKFAKYWENEATHNLHQTRKEFQDSIYIEKIDDKSVIVGLHGFIPNAVEQGLEPFDEKVGFGRSSKVKYTKDGHWYLTIPFRFNTPGTLGESTVFSNQLPEEIHQIVKFKNKAGDTSGLKKSEIPQQFQIPKTRPKIELESKTFEEYTHKSSIYEGMVKSNMQFHSQYNTFRRVSEVTSDPNSWIHTGIDARNLSDKALDSMNIDTTVDRAVDQFLSQL